MTSPLVALALVVAIGSGVHSRQLGSIRSFQEKVTIPPAGLRLAFKTRPQRDWRRTVVSVTATEGRAAAQPAIRMVLEGRDVRSETSAPKCLEETYSPRPPSCTARVGVQLKGNRPHALALIIERVSPDEGATIELGISIYDPFE